MKNNLKYSNDILSLFEKNKELGDIALREKGFTALQEIGFPGHKHEEWKYTNPDKMIISDYFSTSSISLYNTDLKEVKSISKSKVVSTFIFVDGLFQPTLSQVENPTFSIEWKKEESADLDFGSYMNLQNESFLALNALLHSQILTLNFDSKSKHQLEIIHVISGKSGLSNPRINLRLAPLAEVEIIEQIIDLQEGENSALYNLSTNAILEDNAKLEIHKIQSQLKLESKVVDTLKVLLNQNSSAYINTFSISAGITRNNIYAILNGEGGYFDIKGLYLLDNKEHVDNRTIIEHAVPNCNSNQLYKGVLNGSSTGVFNGKIVVKQDAQKTNAFQSNKNLLMSKDASIYTKPQLEIFADDVKCSHGATSSQPDADALFYLKSRGISSAIAKSILTYAFANEITDNIANEKVKTYVSEQIAQKLELEWI